ncbi:copper-binding protein [Brevundimonas sp. SPF441]|uniref:copper-binding protein n=1 Tax=Brevundimonas sp. SPF441 TaxID=2663795 RepID=UPI00129E2609|nr:copper-binding protein [Brevundimonas sp. SPF441]MRL67347.1 copper-binding protein [Brevundimonas sp. SPF441]
MTRTLISLAGAAMMLSACGQPADPAAEPAAAAPVDTASAAGAADTATSPAAGSKSGSGAGVVTAVDTAAGTVTINHEAIPAVGWPAMTMSFTADPAVVQQAAVGDRVQFDLTVQGNAGEVTAIRPE